MLLGLKLLAHGWDLSLPAGTDRAGGCSELLGTRAGLSSGMLRLWDAPALACSGSGMLWLWDALVLACSGFGMLWLQDDLALGCSCSGMLWLWDALAPGCSGTRMLWLQNALVLACSCSGMLQLWGALALGCSSSGMFWLWDALALGCSSSGMLVSIMGWRKHPKVAGEMGLAELLQFPGPLLGPSGVAWVPPSKDDGKGVIL